MALIRAAAPHALTEGEVELRIVDSTEDDDDDGDIDSAIPKIPDASTIHPATWRMRRAIGESVEDDAQSAGGGTAALVAALMAYGAGGAVLAFALWIAPMSQIWGRVNTLDPETGRHAYHGWWAVAGSAIFYAVLVPVWISLLVQVLYGARATNVTHNPPVAWSLPRFPARAMWTDKRLLIPYILGLLASLACFAPPIYTVEGDESATASSMKTFDTVGILMFVLGSALGLWWSCSGEHRLLPASFKNQSLSWLLAIMAIYVPMHVGRVVQKTNAIDRDLWRGVVTVVVWPVVRAITAMIVRKASFDLTDHNRYGDQAFVTAIAGFGALVTRFLMTTMSTLEGRIAVIFGQGMVELFMRQSATGSKCDRFLYVNILRHSKEEADVRFCSDSYRRYRARVVICEMVVEYCCILLAPAVVALYEPDRLFINFGFPAEEPLKASDLVLAAVLQLANEFLVDVLCVRVEVTLGIPVTAMWRTGSCTTQAATVRRDITPTIKLRRLVYLFHVPAAILIGYYLMSALFRFHVPPECQPFPCNLTMQCINKTNGAGINGLAGKGPAAEITRWCNLTRDARSAFFD